MAMSINITQAQASVPINELVRQTAPDMEKRNANAASKRQTAIRKFVEDMPGGSAAQSANENIQQLQKMAAESAAKLNTSAFNKKLQFVVDSRSDDVTVQVVDSETNKVIKVLPPEELRSINNGPKDGAGILVNRMM